MSAAALNNGADYLIAAVPTQGQTQRKVPVPHVR